MYSAELTYEQRKELRLKKRNKKATEEPKPSKPPKPAHLTKEAIQKAAQSPRLAPKKPHEDKRSSPVPPASLHPQEGAANGSKATGHTHLERQNQQLSDELAKLRDEASRLEKKLKRKITFRDHHRHHHDIPPPPARQHHRSSTTAPPPPARQHHRHQQTAPTISTTAPPTARQHHPTSTQHHRSSTQAPPHTRRQDQLTITRTTATSISPPPPSYINIHIITSPPPPSSHQHLHHHYITISTITTSPPPPSLHHHLHHHYITTSTITRSPPPPSLHPTSTPPSLHHHLHHRYITTSTITTSPPPSSLHHYLHHHYITTYTPSRNICLHYYHKYKKAILIDPTQGLPLTTVELKNSKEEVLITIMMTAGMTPKAIQHLSRITREIVMTSKAQTIATRSNTMLITMATMAIMNTFTMLITVRVPVVAMVTKRPQDMARTKGVMRPQCLTHGRPPRNLTWSRGIWC
eukprot:Em0003g1564a